MDLTSIVILGVLGSGALLFLCYSMFILFTNPYEFTRLNHERCKSNFFYRHIMLLAPPFVLCFGMNQVAFSLLGWMPEDWGSFGENGFITLRSSLSTTIGVLLGFFLSWAIGRGIIAQVELSAIRLETYLNKRIKSALNTGQLDELKENLETALTEGRLFAIDKQLYYAINDSGLPAESVA